MTQLNIELIKAKLSSKSDQELVLILTNSREDYENAALEIIEEILLSRGKSIENIESYKHQYLVQKNQTLSPQKNFSSAPFLYRFLQYITDHFLIFIFAYIFESFVPFTPESILSPESFVLILYAGYFFFTEWFFCQTPGMMILNLRIVRSNDLKKIKIDDSILRSLGRLLNILTLQLGTLLIFTNSKKQTLHDMISKTLVVKL